MKRLAVILVVAVVGAPPAPAPAQEAARPTKAADWGIDLSAALALSPWIQELKKLKKRGDLVAQLDFAREGERNPRYREPVVRSLVLTFFLQALDDYVDLYGATPELDAEARSSYEEGLSLARSEAERMRFERVMMVYESSAGRTGRAFVHARRQVSYWERVGGPLELMTTYGSLAASYSDMGQVALRDHYRSKALKVARGYFVLGERPESQRQWSTYTKVLWKRVDDVAGPGRAAEVMALWEILEPIADRYSATKHKQYKRLAQYLAVCGDFGAAEKYQRRAWEEWRKLAPRLVPRNRSAGELDLTCADALISVRKADYVTGLRLIEQCREGWKALGATPGLQIPRYAGRAYEGVGDLERAVAAYRESIDRIERTRASFALADRVTFFQNGAQPSYWGLVRSLTRLAGQSGDAALFLAALEASEQLKSRQLGEVLDAGTNLPTAARLARLQRELPPDTAVLDYVVTDREVVLLAFDRTRWELRVLPVEVRQLEEMLRATALDLSRPLEAPGVIARRLDQLGQWLVEPAASVLAGKKALVVLPDGPMNFVPFDLLGAPGEEGVPLIRHYAVTVEPSLRLMLRGPGQRKTPESSALFALADPSYRQSIEIAGLSGAELRSASRSGDYLGYFVPLPETRTEVQAISSLFDAESTRVVTGSEASESTVKRSDLRPYRFLHFATHGIVGGEVPGVPEPALVLAAEPGEDGFLTASEAQELQLDADITVLSACKTGSGEFVTGEGVLGMSRAFLVAGSRAVVMSLWSVDSKATERLMVRFYHYLRQPMNAAAALRKAKLDVAAGATSASGPGRGLGVTEGKAGSDHLAHPYYWGAFVLFGGRAS